MLRVAQHDKLAKKRVSQQSVKILDASFFVRPTDRVARELLGKYLVRSIRGRTEAVQITEVEVYDGFSDRGSHAARGVTKRNFPMFGPAGYWYVYFTYGMHWMLNIVTRESSYPAAILIRAASLPPHSTFHIPPTRLNGPAKLTKALRITGKLNNLPATPAAGLWIEDRGACPVRSKISNGVKISPEQIKKGPRVGIAYAGPYWSRRHLRFWLDSRN